MKYDHLLTNTESLINQIFWFQQTITKPKAASHRGVAIKYVDVKEMRQGFIRELKSTAMSWVYSKKKYAQLLHDELPKRGGDVMNVQGYLHEVADQKFRKGCPQGQFGELLLFNFIQHFFKAPPLLRKMPITTNPGVERHGADAIHYHETQDAKTFILGESKCYLSRYQFNAALKQVLFRHGIEGESRLKNVGLYIDQQLLKNTLKVLSEIRASREVVLANRYWDPLDLDRMYEIFRVSRKKFPTNIFDQQLGLTLLDWVRMMQAKFPFYFNRNLKEGLDDRYLFGVAKSADSWAREKPLS